MTTPTVAVRDFTAWLDKLDAKLDELEAGVREVENHLTGLRILTLPACPCRSTVIELRGAQGHAVRQTSPAPLSPTTSNRRVIRSGDLKEGLAK